MFIAALFIITLNWNLPQEYVNRTLDKKNLAYSLNGTLYSNKREPTADICNNTDESQKHYVE